MGCIISTKYPSIDNPFEPEVNYAKRVLDGLEDDETVFALLYEPDDIQNWTNNDDVLKHSNPVALEIPEIWEDLIKKRTKAIAMENTRENFLTKHCNIIYKGAGTESFVDINSVLACRTDKIDWTGRNVYIGVDLSMTNDNCAVAMSSEDDDIILADVIAFIPEDRIEVVYNGIDHSLFYPRTELYTDVVTIKPFAIKRPYLIYASRLQGPAKKHVELIRAFSAFKKATGLPHRLVLAGESGAYSDMVQKESIQSEYASDIFLTGFFPHDSLPELYANADACIFPSVCEGVGLPVIEAMACGIPVACAKFGALPEIADKYAVYFTPDNIEETASVLKKIVTDNDLRSNQITSGIECTKKFDWKKTARETYEIIRKIVAQ